MHFLYPAFLWALSALAIPLIIHLFSFRRYKKVYFTNVQFLQEVELQQAGRRNLRERLILLSRLLMIGFLVLAFAQPYIPGKDASAAGKQQVVSIFVDNSYSMQTINKEGTLLGQAKERARQIAGAYGINDRFQILTNDFEGRHQRLLSLSEFNDAVDTIKASPRHRTLTEIISRQQQLLNMQAGIPAHSYILSDFQQNMAAAKPSEATHMRVNLVRITPGSFPNMAVDSVWFLSAKHRPGETERLVVKLHNYADKPAVKVPLSLSINGKQKAVGSFSVKERTVQNDTLTFSGLDAGWQSGVIELQDNPVVFDNHFYFAFNVTDQLPVLLVHADTANKYLNAVFSTDGFFKPSTVAYGSVDYTSLNSYPLVVLSDVKNISTGLAQQLRAYVQNGGNLMIFPSTMADAGSYQALLQPLGAAYPSKLISAKTKASAINLQNPVFSNMFEAAPQNPDLPFANKYYHMEPGNSRSEYLIRLQSGTDMLQVTTSGRGRVYTSAVPLNEEFSNLPVHGLFVPIMLRIALLSGHDGPLFYSTERNAAMETVPLRSSEKSIVKLSNGKETIIPEVRQQDGSSVLYLPGQLLHAGAYRLIQQDNLAAVLAFNNSNSESDLRYLDNSALAREVPGNASTTEADKLNINRINSIANWGLQLWKLCIILALIFMATEILLVRYFKVNKPHFPDPDHIS
ncbi:hypothetical protein CKK33_11265 [Mucilaginibacter sp. MD40]|uniref:BatA domain-containing protein n=1 Tax=Mucilaginibacter sp. MD40 TaxID=2029590 RepID=UPI000BAC5AFA|nr:BatA domain-containing protein [Mucilaginibacter sp. MD40]PAW94041.1 hypothetical protein CKK33_11265 [Mucilaginibacter sp. MD40]